MSKFNVFLSYSWKNSDVADIIDSELTELGINILRDVRDASGYKVSIKQFMKSVRKTDYVLMLISQEFLRSANCMFEVLELSKEPNYEKRILHIVLENVDIYSSKGKLSFIEYWDKQYKDLKRQCKNVEIDSLIAILEDLKHLRSINFNIGEFLSIISDEISISFAELESSKYSKILEYVNYEGQVSPSSSGISDILNEIGSGKKLRILFKPKQNQLTNENLSEKFVEIIETYCKENGIITLDWNAGNEICPYCYFPSYNLMKVACKHEYFKEHHVDLKKSYECNDIKNELSAIWHDSEGGAKRFVEIISGKDDKIVAFLRNVHWTAEENQEDTYYYGKELPILNKKITVIMDAWENVDLDNEYINFFHYFVIESGNESIEVIKL